MGVSRRWVGDEERKSKERRGVWQDGKQKQRKKGGHGKRIRACLCGCARGCWAQPQSSDRDDVEVPEIMMTQAYMRNVDDLFQIPARSKK